MSERAHERNAAGAAKAAEAPATAGPARAPPPAWVALALRPPGEAGLEREARLVGARADDPQSRVPAPAITRGPGGPAPPAEARSGKPLPPGVSRDLAPIVGSPVDNVRVHDDAAAASQARFLDASAFTVGRDIFFGAREYAPATTRGRRLIAHEVAHTVQQGSGPPLLQRQDINEQPTAMTTATAPVPAQTPPVLWGIEPETRNMFMSVRGGGHTIAEVATYAYGDAGAAEALRAANPGLADPLSPGSVVRLTGSNQLTERAGNDFNQAVTQGIVLRSTLDAAASQGQGIMYTFGAAGQTFSLTEGQFRGMLHGLATWISRKAQFIHASAGNGRWVQQDHVNNTNSVVRNISDWLGDNPPPYEGMWSSPESISQRIVDTIHEREPVFGAAAGQTELTPLADFVSRQARILEIAAGALDDAERQWHQYIEGTIRGAEIAQHRLELTRNISFGIAAGIAGAIAAPAVFTVASFAGASALGASALAVGGGAIAGGVTAGGLELTGALGGEGLAVATTPGASFDWGYVGDRTVSGLGSGAIAGGVGAAGALAAPGVSGALSSRFIAGGVPQTLLQRTAINVATGTIVGAPSGAVSSSLENLPALIRGQITRDEYLARMGMGAGLGGALGGVFSLLPITGLTRPGEFPQWMIEGGPFNPRFEPLPGANAQFHALPAERLPPLPRGYAWAQANGQWIPMRMYGATPVSLQLRMYAPSPGAELNFNLVGNGQLVMSSAQTRASGTGPPQSARAYPMGTADYIDPMTGIRYVRGHNIDFADTPPVGPGPDTNLDPANFTPEVSWWGLNVRNPLVGQIRAAAGGYRQINIYAENPPVTANGTPIPEAVIFLQTQGGTTVAAWRIPYSYNYAPGPRGLASLPQFAINPATLPPILRAPPPRIDMSAAVGSGVGFLDDSAQH